MRSRVQVSLPLRTINTLQRIGRFVFYLSKIATVIRSFLGKPVEFAFFEQDERDPGCRFRTTTFAGEKCLLTRSIFRDSLKCSTVIPRSQPISVTGASSITRQTAITWPHSTRSGPNGHLKGSCKRYPDEARYISKILEQKAYPEQAYKSCSGFRALPGESVRNGLRKPAVGQYNSRDRRDT